MTKQQRIEALEHIIRETLWMACRYAHGRQSYAVGKYNDAAREAEALGVVPLPRQPEPIFAIDGTLSAEMSGLTQDEFARAWNAWHAPETIRNHCNAKFPTHSPECPVHSGKKCCCTGGKF